MGVLSWFRRRSTDLPRMATQSPDNLGSMPLGDHLEELRKRVMMAAWGVIPIFILALVFGRRILSFLAVPLERALGNNGASGGLLVTGLLEGFATWVKMGLIVTLMIGAPWIMYQLWKFIAPGLLSREKRFVHILLPMSAVLTIVGVSFMYFIILNFALNFFIHFNQALVTRPPIPTAPLPEGVSLGSLPVLQADPPEFKPGEVWINQSLRQVRIGVGGVNGSPAHILNMPLGDDSMVAQHYKLNEYLGTVLTFALGAAVAFQTPVVVLLLGWSGIIKRELMGKYRKHVLATITVLAAMFTPPDPFSMLAMMVPLYLLFELGLWMLKVMPADRVASGSILKRKPALAAAPDQPGAPSGASEDDPYNRPDDR